MTKDNSTVSAAPHNSLTEHSRVTGIIVAQNDFRVDGEIEGSINCKGKVVVGEGGIMKGNIICISAEIIGNVIGDITASESVAFRSTANVKSNIQTRILIVEPNAVFDDSCSIKMNR